MYLGVVIGNIVSTIKDEDYRGHKLMLVQPVTPEGNPWKKSLIAVDLVGAGPGETVLYFNEGNSARQLLDLGKDGAARAVIVGIVDQVELAEETDRRLREMEPVARDDRLGWESS